MSIKEQVLWDWESTSQPGSLNPHYSMLWRPLSSPLFKDDVELREEEACWGYSSQNDSKPPTMWLTSFMDSLKTHVYLQHKIPFMTLSSALWERVENVLLYSRGEVNSFPLVSSSFIFCLFVCFSSQGSSGCPRAFSIEQAILKHRD